MNINKNLNDITIKKIGYCNLPKSFKNNLLDNKLYEYYCVLGNNNILGYFIAYNNIFHPNNKYIYPIEQTFSVINEREIFIKISNFFNKSLQLMIDSNQKEIIKELNKIGFILKRQSFEREFKFKDLRKDKNLKIIKLEIINKESKYFNEASKIAFNHYVKTHKEINAFSNTLTHFRTILPNEVICQINNDKIINLAFVDKNELCYFGSENEKEFDSFVESMVAYSFSKYQTIIIEVDSTDLLALKVNSYFIDNHKDSFDTYIFNKQS